MKYQYEMDGNLETSQGRVLSHIPQGSTVLECGCATGYMTRYMSEHMGCRVSIIEYEQAAFEIAKQYAVDGLCCDLMEGGWLEHFDGQKFDVILFVDVLEHLSNPGEVLASAAKLLKDDGLVLVSIPNVAHNDIILKLLHNHWDYTNTGLLDDTHIHFWGAENLDDFAQKAGFRIVCREGTYAPTLSTEQMVLREMSAEEFRLLQTRQYGEVYQFILTLQKEEYAAQNNIVQEDRLSKGTGFEPYFDSDKMKAATLYLADAIGEFSADRCYRTSYELKDHTQVHIEAEIPDSVRELRLDPAENRCVVSNLQAVCDGKALLCRGANGVSFDGLWAFDTEDPQILLTVPNGTNRVVSIDYSVCFDTDIASWAAKRIKPFALAEKIRRKFKFLCAHQ